MSELEILKNIAPITTPFINAIVETWLKPKFAKFFKAKEADDVLFQHALTNKFEEYLLRSFAKHSYLTTIVFQNQRKLLADLYLPLSVKSQRGKSLIKIDSYKEEFIPKYQNVLIVDTAGMGKSTISKYLFLCCVNENKGIPIFIELRKLSSETSILEYICNELNALDIEFDKDFILKLIKRGDFVFFLDGYDEIPFSERQYVTNNLREFISKANNNNFVLTSRPESFLASFSDFQEFNIEPLNLEESFELIRKYDKSQVISEQLISKLREAEFNNVREFLANPLLVSLLYKAYEYKPTIPFKKHIFYRQVYDSLFESHDFTKEGAFVREKHTGLDIEDFHRVLRTLGFITIKLGKIEYDKDEILSLLKQAKEHSPGIDYKESKFLDDLLTTVPLFNRDGAYYKWSHKSIQEYFAAQFICIDAKENQKAILQSLYKSQNQEKYFNVLDLCYDIDYKSFRRAIIYDLINDFLTYHDSSYSQIDRKQISEKDIHDRKLFTFGQTIIVYSDIKDKKAKTNHKELEDLYRKISKTDSDWSVHSGAGYNLEGFRGYATLLLPLLKTKNLEIVYRHKGGTPVLKALTLRTPTILNDDPRSPLNKKSQFGKVNVYLSWMNLLLLDVAKCRVLKQEIEEEIQRENSDSFLLNGF